MVPEAPLSAIAEAVFGHPLQEANLADRVHAMLGASPQRCALRTARAQACAAFARQYPTWTASLFDETFLRRLAAPFLAPLVIRRAIPTRLTWPAGGPGPWATPTPMPGVLKPSAGCWNAPGPDRRSSGH